MEREKKREKKGGENVGKEKKKKTNIKRYMGGRVVLGTSCKMGRQPSLSLDSGLPSKLSPSTNRITQGDISPSRLRPKVAGRCPVRPPLTS